MNGARRRSASSTGPRIRRRFAGSEDTASEARKRIIEKTTGTAQRCLQTGVGQRGTGSIAESGRLVQSLGRRVEGDGLTGRWWARQQEVRGVRPSGSSE